jgi:hypothetical protein
MVKDEGSAAAPASSVSQSVKSNKRKHAASASTALALAAEVSGDEDGHYSPPKHARGTLKRLAGPKDVVYGGRGREGDAPLEDQRDDESLTEEGGLPKSAWFPLDIVWAKYPGYPFWPGMVGLPACSCSLPFSSSWTFPPLLLSSPYLVVFCFLGDRREHRTWSTTKTPSTHASSLLLRRKQLVSLPFPSSSVESSPCSFTFSHLCSRRSWVKESNLLPFADLRLTSVYDEFHRSKKAKHVTMLFEEANEIAARKWMEQIDQLEEDVTAMTGSVESSSSSSSSFCFLLLLFFSKHNHIFFPSSFFCFHHFCSRSNQSHL